MDTAQSLQHSNDNLQRQAAGASDATQDLLLFEQEPEEDGRCHGPQPVEISNGLIRGCAARDCLETANLKFCPACRAVPYCGREHQSIDRAQHRFVCNEVKKARAEFEKSKWFYEQTIFYSGSPDRLHARLECYAHWSMKLLLALRKINTYHAVESSLDGLMNMHQLESRICNLIPALYLRLNRDQETYNYCKWQVIP